MEDKKYTFHFTVGEIMILSFALNCADKPIEYTNQGKISENLKEQFSRRIDKIFSISDGQKPKKER